MNKRGFTLIEMVVAIVIITILAALVVPSSLRYIKEYQDEKYIVDANKVYIEAQMFVVKKRVQYQVVSITDSIQYKDCTLMYEKTAPFRDAVAELFACEKNVSIYHIAGVSVDLNEQFQLIECKVDYQLDGGRKTIAFDSEGNATIFDS